MSQTEHIPTGEQAFISPCLTDPCPCGTFFEKHDIKYKGKLTGQQSLIPIQDITVYAHDAGTLIICTSRARREVEALIDRRWIFQRSWKCKEQCLGNKFKSRHLKFKLQAPPKRAHLTIQLAPHSRCESNGSSSN